MLMIPTSTSVPLVIIYLAVLLSILRSTCSTTEASRSRDASNFPKEYYPEKITLIYANFNFTPIFTWQLESTVSSETNKSSSPTNLPTTLIKINTSIPTNVPTISRTLKPSLLPLENPTSNPSFNPTTPTELPSISPTMSPSSNPSTWPTVEPTLVPSAPSTMPTINPTKLPSTSPTSLPTKNPSMNPTKNPSLEPTAVPSRPTHVPTKNPSVSPSLTPTIPPTKNPTQGPTKPPTENPSIAPSAPSSVPTINPTEAPTDYPTRLPSTTPTYIPTHKPTSSPTQQPTYPEVDLPDYYNWYYVGINSHTFFVAYMVYFAFYGVYTIASCCCTGGWTSEEIKKFKLNSSFFFSFYWILFETILLCARMTHLLNLPSGTYHPRFTTSHTMVWLGPAYDTAGPNTRFNAGCPAKSDIGHRASYDVCEFLFFPLNAEIMIEGAVKFSVGLGIGFYFVIQVFIAIVDAQMEWLRVENPEAYPLLYIRSLSIALKMTIGCLQAVVLLPIQAIQMNPYCAFIETPMSQKQTMCVFKWSAVAIPYGIPMAVGALIFAWLTAVFDENYIGILCGFCCFLLGTWSVGLFVIYLCAGIPLGIWFKMTAIGSKQLLEGSLLLDVLASTGVYLPSLNQALLSLVTAREVVLESADIAPTQVDVSEVKI